MSHMYDSSLLVKDKTSTPYLLQLFKRYMADIRALKKLPPLNLYAFQNYHPGRCLLASSIGTSKMFIELRSFSHLMPLVSFYTLWKYQKTSVSLIVFTFSFSIGVFFRRHWRFTGQQGKGGDHLLFHSTTSTHSRTLRYLRIL